MKLLYTPEAMRDLKEMKEYIAGTLYNPAAATRIARGILQSCARLKAHPSLGLSIQEKTGQPTQLRYLLCEKHHTFYRIDGQRVLIARILNSRQDYLPHDNEADEDDQQPGCTNGESGFLWNRDIHAGGHLEHVNDGGCMICLHMNERLAQWPPTAESLAGNLRLMPSK